MTRNNPSKLDAGDPKIERIGFQNPRVRLRKRAKELELEFEVDQSKVMAEAQRIMFKYARPSLCGK